MLTPAQRHTLRLDLIREISRFSTSGGINTRTLATHYLHISSIPNLNSHHVYGMLGWLIKSGLHHLSPRTSGFSVVY